VWVCTFVASDSCLFKHLTFELSAFPSMTRQRGYTYIALVGLCNVQLSLVQKAKKKSWLQNETQHTLENTILFCCNGGLLFLMQSACFCNATKPCKNWLGFLKFIVDHYNTNPPSYMCLHKFSFHKERWSEGGFLNPNPPTTFIKMGFINVTHICPLMGCPQRAIHPLIFQILGPSIKGLKAFLSVQWAL
jgi:hypothetical protein